MPARISIECDIVCAMIVTPMDRRSTAGYPALGGLLGVGVITHRIFVLL
jgi:hypothetical protein